MFNQQFNLNFGGSPEKSGDPKGDLEAELVFNELKGMPRTYFDHDLDKLKKLHKEDLLGNVGDQALSIITKGKTLHSRKELPHTLGVFGRWGCGKTHLLSEIARKCEEDSIDVVYFNTFKYATYMEIVPSLIYRLLGLEKPYSGARKMLTMAADLAKQHRTKEYNLAVNLARTGRSLYGLSKNIKSDKQLERTLEYYGRVDKFHDTLLKAFRERQGPIFVLIDELDRCNPTEAFDVIQQLRVLFCATGLPFFFVLAVNPDPIGRTIQSKFNLSGHEDYESIRILEKFVDSTKYFPKKRDLSNFVTSIWNRAGLNSERICNLHSLCARHFGQVFIPESFWKLPIYSNLRLMEKVANSISEDFSESKNLWSRWNLALLEIVNPGLANKIKRLDETFIVATDEATGITISKFMPKTLEPIICSAQTIDCSIIKVYRAEFVRSLTKFTGNGKPASAESENTVVEILSDSESLDTVIMVSLLNLSTDDSLRFQNLSEDRFSLIVKHGIDSINDLRFIIQG